MHCPSKRGVLLRLPGLLASAAFSLAMWKHGGPHLWLSVPAVLSLALPVCRPLRWFSALSCLLLFG